MHPMQRAFHEEHALQCGYCTPGMVMAAIDLLRDTPDPSEETIRQGLEGNSAGAPDTATSCARCAGARQEMGQAVKTLMTEVGTAEEGARRTPGY